MAEFCSQCTPLDTVDYNLFNIALNLDRGHSRSFVCEGCDNRAVYKDEEGRLWIAHENGKGDLDWKPVTIDEL